MPSDDWDTLLASKIDELKSSWSLEALSPRRALSGKSGALIFLVDSKGGYDGLAILKIFPESQSEEISLQIKACNEGGSFSHLRFPSIARKHASENWSAVLMTVAGDGLQYVDPLSDVSEVERTKAIGSVLQGILSEWNSLAKAADNCSAAEVIHNWLGQKLDPNGRLSQVFEDLTGQSSSTKGFRLNELDFPNPLASCHRQDSALCDLLMSPIVGHTHGVCIAETF